MLNKTFEGSAFKKFSGPNDLTRLEGTRRKTRLSLMDEDDGVRRKVRANQAFPEYMVESGDSS